MKILKILYNVQIIVSINIGYAEGNIVEDIEDVTGIEDVTDIKDLDIIEENAANAKKHIGVVLKTVTN